MFTATEFRLIRAKCPKKLDTLLQELDIDIPNWSKEDEFKAYANLDKMIVSKLCQLMGSESVIGGYMELLELGKVPFNYSERDNELLGKIVQHQSTIKDRASCPDLTRDKSNAEIETGNVFNDVSCKLWNKASHREQGIIKSIVKKSMEKFNGETIGVDNQIQGYCELEEKIRNIICSYWLEHRNKEITSIDVVLEYKDRPMCARNQKKDKLQRSMSFTSPLISSSNLDQLFSVLKIVDDVVKNIDS